jgi:hypothetical protein
MSLALSLSLSLSLPLPLSLSALTFVCSFRAAWFLFEPHLFVSQVYYWDDQDDAESVGW